MDIIEPSRQDNSPFIQRWEELTEAQLIDTAAETDENLSITELIDFNSYLNADYRCFKINSAFTGAANSGNEKYAIGILDFKFKEALNAPISLYAGIYSKTIADSNNNDSDLFDKIFITYPSEVSLTKWLNSLLQLNIWLNNEAVWNDLITNCKEEDITALNTIKILTKQELGGGVFLSTANNGVINLGIDGSNPAWMTETVAYQIITAKITDVNNEWWENGSQLYNIISALDHSGAPKTTVDAAWSHIETLLSLRLYPEVRVETGQVDENGAAIKANTPDTARTFIISAQNESAVSLGETSELINAKYNSIAQDSYISVIYLCQVPTGSANLDYEGEVEDLNTPQAFCLVPSKLSVSKYALEIGSTFKVAAGGDIYAGRGLFTDTLEAPRGGNLDSFMFKHNTLEGPGIKVSAEKLELKDKTKLVLGGSNQLSLSVLSDDTSRIQAHQKLLLQRGSGKISVAEKSNANQIVKQRVVMEVNSSTIKTTTSSSNNIVNNKYEIQFIPMALVNTPLGDGLNVGPIINNILSTLSFSINIKVQTWEKNGSTWSWVDTDASKSKKELQGALRTETFTFYTYYTADGNLKKKEHTVKVRAGTTTTSTSVYISEAVNIIKYKGINTNTTSTSASSSCEYSFNTTVATYPGQLIFDTRQAAESGEPEVFGDINLYGKTTIYSDVNIGVFDPIGTSYPGNLSVNGTITATGNIRTSGTITGSNIGQSSDRRLKTNIQALSESSNYLDVFDQLTPVEFKYLNNPAKIQLGFIAQDLQEALIKAPHPASEYGMVDVDISTEKLIVNYSNIIALNTLQIKALKEQVKDLEAQIKELRENK